MDLSSLISKYLREIADRIDDGTCEITREEQNAILNAISHAPMSKTQAYQHIGVSRSVFDTLVKDGAIPKGKKRVGFKELVWYKDELDEYLNNQDSN